MYCHAADRFSPDRDDAGSGDRHQDDPSSGRGQACSARTSCTGIQILAERPGGSVTDPEVSSDPGTRKGHRDNPAGRVHCRRPRLVTVGLAAAIQNRLSWRACEKVSGAINFLRRWYRELPRLSLHRARCEKGGQDTGGNRDLRQRPHSPRERGSRRVAVVTGYGLRPTAA
jgi:hypothetical protein